MSTKTIIPNQTFKHGRETYEKGKEYEVPAEEAYYFQSVGWLGPLASEPKEATLEIQDTVMGHKAEVK